MYQSYLSLIKLSPLLVYGTTLNEMVNVIAKATHCNNFNIVAYLPF